MKLTEIAKFCHGQILKDTTKEITSISNDTRTLAKGALYIPIVGEVFDGHNFIDKAFENGAVATFTSDLDLEINHEGVIYVKDTTQALQDLARSIREASHAKVVSVTGSVGKTSTRDMIAAVVASQFKTLKTEGNYNNEIGLPLTIGRYQDEEAMVLEMGMDQKGQISTLSKIAKPNYAVITNVGTAHIGNLGSREAILKAKLEIRDGLQGGGTLVINIDNDMLYSFYQENKHLDLSYKMVTVGIDHNADVRAYDIDLYDDGSIFKYKDKTYKLNVPGLHFVYNALSAIAIGEAMRIPYDQMAEALENFKLTKNRMDQLDLTMGIQIMDGSYNASLDSMKSTLSVLSTYEGRKVAILGDMLELGKYSHELHLQTGKACNEAHVDVLVAIGDESKAIIEGATEVPECHWYKNVEDAKGPIRHLIQPQDHVVVKASNGMRLRDIVLDLKEYFKMKKVLVLVGGQSTEHRISRMSGTCVVERLNKERYTIDVCGIDLDGQWYLLNSEVTDYTSDHWLMQSKPVSNVFGLLKSYDVIFPVLHGSYGEDGTIQGLFELAKVPYVGCKVLGSAVAMDKVYAKRLFHYAGIPQTPSVYIKKRLDGRLVLVNDDGSETEDFIDVVEETLGFPVFIKPSNSGSSVGVSKANKEDFMEQLAQAATFDRKLLVEKNIRCLELETAVLGNDDVEVSDVGQIMPHGEFYTFESKYDDPESRTCIPAKVDVKTREYIRELAKKAFKAVDGHGLSRVDFFLDQDTGDIYLNEINTLPGFTTISMYSQLWEHQGLGYTELLDRLIELALEC